MKSGTNIANRRSAGNSTAARHKKTRRDNASEVAEDYVEAIAGLLQSKGEARGVDLARHFGVTPVTVIHTIARLKRTGLVRSEPYRAIFLTDKGRQLAAHCQRRHQLVRDFLRAVGVPEAVADQDAEGIEHHVSAETLAAFKAWMEKPGLSGASNGR